MSSTASDSDPDPPDPAPTPAQVVQPINADIDVTTQPAVAAWRCPDDQAQSLPQLTFDLHYNVRSNKAFFKLRAAVALKAHPRSHKTNMFLFIHPERIRTVVLDDSPPDVIEAKRLGSDTICLRFDLSGVPTLVGPKESLAPRNQVSGNTLDCLRALSRQTAFTVYCRVSCRSLPRRQLVSLCEAASHGRLSSIAAHSNTASLYAGQGGRVVEGDDVGAATSNAPVDPARGHENDVALGIPTESPPAYDQLPSDSQGQAESGSHSKKRRRYSPEPVGGVDRKYIEDICANVLDTRLAGLRRDMAKQLQDLETRLVDYVDESLGVQRKEMSVDMDNKIEDEYHGVKLDLQSYVREEVEDAEGRFMDQLTNASVSLQFNI